MRQWHSSRALTAVVFAWAICAGLFAVEPSWAKGIADRTFEPAPPDGGYAAVWANTETAITLRFDPALPAPVPAAVPFTDDDGHGGTTVAAVAQQVEPGTWRAVFVLPHPGRWEGSHPYSPPFAVRAFPAQGSPDQAGTPGPVPGLALALAAAGIGAGLVLRRRRA